MGQYATHRSIIYRKIVTDFRYTQITRPDPNYFGLGYELGDLLPWFQGARSFIIADCEKIEHDPGSRFQVR